MRPQNLLYLKNEFINWADFLDTDCKCNYFWLDRDHTLYLLHAIKKERYYYSCKNIQKLMTELYKYLYGLSAAIMKEVFTKRLSQYNFRNCKLTLLPNPETKKYGTNTVAYEASQLWRLLLTRYKNLPSLDLFKSEIKNWHCSDCPCNICRIFVDGVGFINWN